MIPSFIIDLQIFKKQNNSKIEKFGLCLIRKVTSYFQRYYSCTRPLPLIK